MGMRFVISIRDQGNICSFIFVTAMDREFDEIKGLEYGGDDYLRKPFSPNILSARINAIFRRIEKNQNKEERLLNMASYRLTQIPILQRLMEKSYFFLLQNLSLQVRVTIPILFFSRESLLSSIMKDDVNGDRTIDVHINRIRHHGL